MDSYFIILLIFCLVCGFVSANLGKKKGYSYGAFFALGFFLAIIGVVIALVVQDKRSNMADAADGVLKYKQLLDEGIISQEEFDKRKNALLAQDEKPNDYQKAKSKIFANSIVIMAISAMVALFSIGSIVQDDITAIIGRTFLIVLAVAAIASCAHAAIVMCAIPKRRELIPFALICGIASIVLVVASFFVGMGAGALGYFALLIVLGFVMAVLVAISSIITFLARK